MRSWRQEGRAAAILAEEKVVPDDDVPDAEPIAVMTGGGSSSLTDSMESLDSVV